MGDPVNRRPIFLDRDGVLNVDVTPYISRREQFELFPFTVRALTMLHEAGYDLYVISNQQGIALGITPPEELEACSEMVQASIRPHGFQVRKFYYCTAHDRDRHPWRKPAPGMVLAAGQEFDFDPVGAFLIGDKWTDMEAAGRAGCRGLLVMSGVTPKTAPTDWEYPPERVFPTLLEAAEWVVSQTPSA